MKIIKEYFEFIKKYPIWFIAATIANIICLSDSGYNKIFDNDLLNFFFCEALLLFIYLIVFLQIRRNLKK